MDPLLTPLSDEIRLERALAAPASGFSISETPLVGASDAGAERSSAEFPRATGNEPLYLLPRDPHSLFAYWDLDWTIAFGEPTPRERDVILKISKVGEAEAKSCSVQPTAGSYLVDGLEADSTYSATLGYYDLSGEWVSLGLSAKITTPAAEIADVGEGDFATVPFHLSFQRMLELLRVPKQESQSLTTMLNELRTRDDNSAAQETRQSDNELVDAIRQAALKDPAPNGVASVAQLWTPELMNQVIGGLCGAGSPPNGFGGSSRAA